MDPRIRIRIHTKMSWIRKTVFLCVFRREITASMKWEGWGRLQGRKAMVLGHPSGLLFTKQDSLLYRTEGWGGGGEGAYSRMMSTGNRYIISCIACSVADPDSWSGAFWPWIRDGKKNSDPVSGIIIPDHISESLETICWVKILKFFAADSDPMEKFWSGMGTTSRIRNPDNVYT